MDSSANLLIVAEVDMPPQPTKTALEFTFTYKSIQKFESIHTMLASFFELLP